MNCQKSRKVPCLGTAWRVSFPYLRCLPGILAGWGVLFSAQPVNGDPTFVETAAAAGVDYVHAFDDTVNHVLRFSLGASVGDYDGDGWLDFFIANGSGHPNRLYHNNGDGTFTDVASAVGADLAMVDREGKCSLFLDYDGDGWLDLFIANDADAFDPDNESPPALIEHKLFRNVGNGTFADVTASANLVTHAYHETPDGWPQVGGVAAADLNGDGFLEIYLSVRAAVDRLMLNNGDGTFTDISISAGIAIEGKDSFTPLMWDVNRDGWMDIHVAVDYTADLMFINQGDLTFVDEAASAGLDTAFNEMGSTLGDYDRDGDLDLYITNIEKAIEPEDPYKWNRLFRNDSVQGILSFTDVGPDLNVHRTGFGWGTTFFDYNNDGWLDLAAVNGSHFGVPQTDPSRFFANNGNGTFTDVSDAVGFNDTRIAASLNSFDFDRDGDLDMLVTNYDESALLFRNEGGDMNWVVVDPVGQAPNTHAIGALVYVTAGGVTQIRQISAGTSFLSQEPDEAHFGIGSSTTIDEIRVQWPDGTANLIKGPPINSLIKIVQGSDELPCEGDANGDGQVDPLDAGYALARFGCPVGTGDPTCDAADVNADLIVDPLDSGFILARFGTCE